MRFKPEGRRGAKHHASKLSEADVLQIREKYDRRESPKSIAVQFNVAASRIVMIGKRQTWAWLPEATEKAAVAP